jgi:hypothetical protein
MAYPITQLLQNPTFWYLTAASLAGIFQSARQDGTDLQSASTHGNDSNPLLSSQEVALAFTQPSHATVVPTAVTDIFTATLAAVESITTDILVVSISDKIDTTATQHKTHTSYISSTTIETKSKTVARGPCASAEVTTTTTDATEKTTVESTSPSFISFALSRQWFSDLLSAYSLNLSSAAIIGGFAIILCCILAYIFRRLIAVWGRWVLDMCITALGKMQVMLKREHRLISDNGAVHREVLSLLSTVGSGSDTKDQLDEIRKLEQAFGLYEKETQELKALQECRHSAIYKFEQCIPRASKNWKHELSVFEEEIRIREAAQDEFKRIIVKLEEQDPKDNGGHDDRDLGESQDISPEPTKWFESKQ